MSITKIVKTLKILIGNYFYYVKNVFATLNDIPGSCYPSLQP